MDYKEKYEKVLEKAKAFLKRWECVEAANSSLVLKEVKDIFPELREPEDEKIRKEIISALKYANHEGVYNKHLAWLEKLKVFAEHGDGLYYFGDNGFIYIGNPTCDNVSYLEEQGKGGGDE